MRGRWRDVICSGWRRIAFTTSAGTNMRSSQGKGSGTAALLGAAGGEPTRPSQTLRGVVEAVTPPGLQVAGVSVVTHNNTQITTRSGSTFNLSALRRGDTVTVRGDRRSDDSLDADEIETEGSEIEFRGVIDSVNPPNLSVAGRVIVTDSATEFGGEDEDSAFTLADLHAGDTVKVEGVQVGEREGG